jgi:hypothetical protein
VSTSEESEYGHRVIDRKQCRQRHLEALRAKKSAGGQRDLHSQSVSPEAAIQRSRSAAAVMINETYAKVLQQYRDPLGAELIFQKNPVTIVGVVGDVRHRDLTSTVLNEIFVPLAQAPEKSSFLEQLAVVVRTTDEPGTVMGALRRLAMTGDKDVAVASLRTMDDYLMTSIAKPTFVGVLPVCSPACRWR